MPPKKVAAKPVAKKTAVKRKSPVKKNADPSKGPTMAELKQMCKDQGLKLGSGYKSRNELLKLTGNSQFIKKKKKKDPLAPKRPLTAYMHYNKDAREELRKKHPEMKVTELAGLVGAQWRALTAAQKVPYEKKAAADKEHYSKLFEKYRAEKEKHAAPKRPRTAYLLFSMEERERILAKTPGTPVTDVAKEVGKKWKSLTPAQKKPFMEQAAVDKERYVKEKAEWEVREGKTSTGTTKTPRAPRGAQGAKTQRGGTSTRGTARVARGGSQTAPRSSRGPVARKAVVPRSSAGRKPKA